MKKNNIYKGNQNKGGKQNRQKQQPANVKKEEVVTEPVEETVEEAIEEDVVEEEVEEEATTEVEPDVDPAESESPEEDEVEEININNEFIGKPFQIPEVGETSDEDMDAAFDLIAGELEQDRRKNTKGFTVRLCENASPLQKAKISKRADKLGVRYFIDPKTNNITTNTFVSLKEAQEYKKFISRKGLKGQIIPL